MPDANRLSSSLELLNTITSKTHNQQTYPVANAVWQKHLQANNPLWEFVKIKTFSVDGSSSSAHVMAMVDSRLPNIGLVGFFGCTDGKSGVEVLNQAVAWLKNDFGLHEVYGPINGTITRDYRFNLEDDYLLPGEPVNPAWYIDVFNAAGFETYNHYVSGISKRYQLAIKPFIRPPSRKLSHIILRPFNANIQAAEFNKYHDLMNAIFPQQSIYCPVLSLEERLFNLASKKPVFDPKYTYFLEDRGRAVGFVVSFPYKGQLILKTVGVLPEYRHKRLSGMLIKRVHDQAEHDGLTAAVYSTIRTNNSVYKMKHPLVKEFRKYITMRHLSTT